MPVKFAPGDLNIFCAHFILSGAVIKEDENSGVKWVPINEVIGMSSEPWMIERVYSKIIGKMKQDKII